MKQMMTVSFYLLLKLEDYGQLVRTMNQPKHRCMHRWMENNNYYYYTRLTASFPGQSE